MEDKETLMRAIKAGDEEALKSIFYEYFLPLFQNAYKYVKDEQIAEELTQDAFVNFWENRQQLTITTSVKNYLFVSVRNLCLNYLKSRYARQKSLFLDASEIDLVDETISENKDTELLQKKIQLAIQKLPEKCRIIFELSRHHGLTYQEIAEELGITKETVKTQIKLALKKLQAFLGQHIEVLALLFYESSKHFINFL